MAVKVNELRQKRIEATRAIDALQDNHVKVKATYSDLLVRQAGGALSASERERLPAAEEELRRSEEKMSAARKTVIVAEEAVAAEEERLRIEDGQLAARRAATGFNSFGERVAADADEDPEPAAVTALPPVSARTRAALARLWPSASSDAEAQRREWASLVSAAINGVPQAIAMGGFRASSMVEGDGAAGGFSVSPSVGQTIFSRAFEQSLFVRAGIRVEPMLSSEHYVVALDDDDETDGAEAGITAGWTAELEAADGQVLGLRRVVLQAKKLLVLARVSGELREDAMPGLLVALETAMSRAIAKRIDKGVLRGTGAGAPLGMIVAGSTVTVAIEAGQTLANGAFLWANACKMWARLAPGLHESAVWAISPSLLPAALSMALPIGTGGAIPQAAFAPDGRGGYTLLGRPVYVSSRLPAAGTVGDALLFSPAEYALGLRSDVAIERSPGPYFTSDELAVRARWRGDGRPLWDVVKTLDDGSTTVGPCVVLAARA